MIDRYLMMRPNSPYWQLRVPVPLDVQNLYGRPVVTRSLRETDRRRAADMALPLILSLRQEWENLRSGSAPKRDGAPTERDMLSLARKLYDRSYSISREKRGSRFEKDPDDYQRWLAQQDHFLTSYAFDIEARRLDRWRSPAEKFLRSHGYKVRGDEPWFDKFVSMVAEVTVSAVDASNRRDRGDAHPEPNSKVLVEAKELMGSSVSEEQQLPFAALVEKYLKQWRASGDVKEGPNTEQQKRSTYRLFGEFFSNRPIRDVTAQDAALFYDTLKLFDPNWARSPSLRILHWNKLVAEVGNRPKGLAANTMNRHMRALQELWKWAKRRGQCKGDNPFADFTTRLKPSVNTHGYLPWRTEELQSLLKPKPRRDDLCEVMIVGLFTGMRVNEIASLTWDQIESERGSDIFYFEIHDSKTPSGVRQVPVHSSLNWLIGRLSEAAVGRIWPNFNKEGPGKRPGADASRMFSTFKLARGFKDRRKTFHSFRKNVTKIMERAGVPENEWAQVLGHERGFTYQTYNPDGITLSRKAEIIELIQYQELEIPFPSA